VSKSNLSLQWQDSNLQTSDCERVATAPEVTFTLGFAADRTMIHLACNQQQDDPERTGILRRTERYCHRSGRE
jgi:hypothetical protein